MTKRKKAILLLVCIPYYPVGLIGEWYGITDNGRKFSLKKFNAEYWREISGLIKR